MYKPSSRLIALALLGVALIGQSTKAGATPQASKPGPKTQAAKPGNPPQTANPATTETTDPSTPKEPAASSELVVIAKIPYVSTLQRDPFASPTDNREETRQETVDEVGIKGQISVKGKQFLVVSDSSGKTKLLQVGYKFRDGEIIAIQPGSVTFRTWDPNSTNKSVFKNVTKSFKREEGKR